MTDRTRPTADGGAVAQPDATARHRPRQSPTTVDDLLVDADSTTTPVLSVVLPTMNEEEGIDTCLDWIEEAVMELGVPTEILVSDSSTDQTPEIARDRGAIVVEPDQRGYGYAYRYAFQQARGEYIVMGDADTTYDFTEIPRLLDHLEATDADIVLGSRFDGEIKSDAMPPLHRYVGNPVLTRFLNTFYGTDVSDAHSGFRLFRRDFLNDIDLQSTGMEFASEMIMKAGVQDADIAEIPIVYHERTGEETLNSFADGWRHVKFMIVNAPAYFFSIPGLILALSGLTLMTVTASGILVNGVAPGVNSMVLASLLTILGVNIGSFGVYATISRNPINYTKDPISNAITDALSLKHGVLTGGATLALGGAIATALLYQWYSSRPVSAAFTMSGLVAFTAILLGVQTILYSFMLSVARD